MKHHKETTSQANLNDLSQTICLFKKYLLNKKPHHFSPINQQSCFHQSTSPPPKFRRRPISLLEQRLLNDPDITRFEGMQSSRDDAENPSTAQLTIFYAGAVNVYDNVSIEKAHAIMVLAGENSLPRPKEKPSTEMRSTQLSACSLQSNLPIARKISLQHFIEKRKSRVMSQSPYAPPARKEKESAPNANDPTNISLLPFILL